MGQGMTFAGLGALMAAPVAVLRRQFWAIALVTVVGSLAALAYGHMQAPVFEAAAVVQVRPGVAVLPVLEQRLMGRDNLIAMALRQQVFAGDAAAVQMRQALAFHDLASQAGQSLGFAPEISGVVVSVRLADREQAARLANDLAQQILDLGNAGALDEDNASLMFYRGEEARLWQEVSALRAELQAVGAGTVGEADQALGADRRLGLLQDQYDLVRARLAEQEVDARLADHGRVGQFSLLERATSAQAVNVVQSWMLAGVAGSLLLAVTLAFVLERRFPAARDLVQARLARSYRLVDDPARPIWGLPRFAVLAVVVVAALVAAAAILK